MTSSASPLPVTTTRSVLHAPDGTALAATAWLPVHPRAVVLLAHGYAEHSGRYGHVSTALVNRGYAVFTHDHRGHGRSSGPRALIRRFDAYVDDLHLLTDHARQTLTGLPHILIGHSMGGLIAIRYALRHGDDLAALVTSGVALIFTDDVAAPLRWLGGLIAPIAPTLPVRPRVRNVLSTDPTVERDFTDDPLCYSGPVKAAIGHAMSTAATDTRARLGELALPLLAMHGAADRLTNPGGSRLLHTHAASPDKTIQLWPGMKHELFQERDRAEVIASMLNWLDARSVPDGPSTR